MKKEWMLTCLLGLALGISVIACELEDELGSHGLNFDAAALIVTTDYETGSYATINLDDPSQVVKNINTIHSDALCHYDANLGIPFIIARGTGSYVDVLDAEDGFDIIGEYTVEAGTNPYDMAVVSDTKAYVSRYDSADLLVVHPTDGTVIDTIDLSAYSDADGSPEAAYMYLLEGKIYLAIQRFDFINFMTGEDSLILVIDAESGEIEEEITLSAKNPSSDIRYNRSMDRLVVVSSGDFGAMDGGIELIDPSDNSVSGLVVTEEALGGDVVDAVVVSETKGYAIVGVITDWENFIGETYLVSFNPQTGKKLDDLDVSDAWTYNAIEVNPAGTELWLADVEMSNPGIRIFDVDTEEEKTEGPIDVGLPPFAICFVE
ncbi:MAG: hypothetical protein GY762_17735 [Proteobacteria bacterium]|nr:hypothetical protein [Pseudomonadota bacterium]